MNKGTNKPGWFVEGNPKEINKNNIKKVVFDASFAEARPTSCYWWFSGCNELTTIEGIENLNTENATNVYAMFYGCTSLKRNRSFQPRHEKCDGHELHVLRL